MKENKLLDLLQKKSLFWQPDYIDISAWTEHIPFAFWIVEVLKPRTLVELGVHNGNSYFAFCQAVKLLNLETTCYGIDTWLGDEHAGFYEKEVFAKVNSYNGTQYPRFSTLIQSTFDEAVSYFPDNSIELLHIDGMHTYEAVKHDFETWLPKLTKDGFVIFHDINVRERQFGVFKFWEELKMTYNHFQFDFGHGLGIICIGEISIDELKIFFEKAKDDDYYLFLRNHFSDRGHAIKSSFDFSLSIKKQQEENAALSDKLTELEANYKTLESHYFHLINVRKTLGEENEQLIMLQKEFERKQVNLENENRGLKDSFDSLQKQYDVTNTAYQGLKTEHEESLAKIKSLSERSQAILLQYKGLNESSEKDKQLLRQKISESDLNVDKAMREIANQQATIAELQKINLWYRSTYEDRSFAGTIKQKLKDLFKKKISGSSIKSHKGKIDRSELLGPLKNQEFDLHPENDLIQLADPNHFKSIGPDPHFIIDLDNRKLSDGWYLISVDLRILKGMIILPKLYFDTGKGFSETNAWGFSGEKNGKVKGPVHFPQPVLRLRFDPTSTESSFMISAFQLTSISKVQVFKYAFLKYAERYAENKIFTALFDIVSLLFKSGWTAAHDKLYDVVSNRDDSYEDKYWKWCSLFDTISADKLRAIKTLSVNLPYQPLFSIVMPVYNPSVKFLKRAIESIRNQAYTNWELCIADDKSTNKNVKPVLLSYQSKDPRIKVVFRDTNGHISQASNSALSLAGGDYVALVDQDDELPPHSLYMVADAINKNKELELIYSDEDKIDEQGHRFDPYFKTDWNKDLFYGQNMISHLGVYKHSLIKKIGGFKTGYEGSQDYDLALRSIEQLTPNQIHHIPHILYHWRATKGSTAVTVSNKNYAVVAGLKALQQHLVRMKENAIAVDNVNNSYRVIWKMPDNPPLVSIIIPTKDKFEILQNCVSSILFKTKYKNYEILIIDNNSSEKGTLEYLDQISKENRNVFIYNYPREFNFSAIVNYGVSRAKGEVVLLLNNDTEVISEGWLDEMVSQCLRKEVGAVGAKLYYPNGQIQHAGVFLYDGHPGNHIYLKRRREDLGYFNKLNLVQHYSAVTGACLAVRKKVYLEAGGFDEDNLKVAYNDVDFCLRLRELGYINVWTPFAELFHHESISRGNDLDEINHHRFKKEQGYMLKKWKKIVARDPYFNPNLYIETHNNQFAFPPRVRYEWDFERADGMNNE